MRVGVGGEGRGGEGRFFCTVMGGGGGSGRGVMWCGMVWYGVKSWEEEEGKKVWLPPTFVFVQGSSGLVGLMAGCRRSGTYSYSTIL